MREAPLWPSPELVEGLNRKLEKADIMMQVVRIMNPKEKLRKALEAMPESASVEEILDELAILARLERSEAQADAGELLDHSEAESLVESWRTK